MLDPEYLLHVGEGAEDIAESLHQDILNRIIERIMHRIGRGDSYLLTTTDKWQIEVLQDAGYLLEDIQREIAKRTKQQEAEIRDAMIDAGVKAIEYDNAIYEAAGLSPLQLMQSPHLMRLMERNYQATLGEWRNYTRATANAAQQAFINACDRAYHLTASGAISYTQAVKEAVESIAGNGVAVEWKRKDENGREYVYHRDTIETATLRAVRTGISQACGQITDARMEEMDWDIVLVSAHLGARVTDKEDYTNHFWWQGKFYSRTGRNKRFPPLSICGIGDVQGLEGANCRHSRGPGDGEHNPFEQYDSEENKKAYELQQRQRALERRIRKTKQETMALKTAVDNAHDDKLKFELDMVYQKKAVLLQKQNKAYNDFCKENNMKPLSDRIQIARWDRQQAAAARGAAKRYNAGKNTVVKNLTIEDLNKVNIKSNGGNIIAPDIMDQIGKALKEKDAMSVFEGVSIIETDEGIVFNTKTSQYGSWCRNELQINKRFFVNKTLGQANLDIKTAKNTVCNSVSDAAIHEIYHAKTADQMNFARYEALSEMDGVKGVSRTAQIDALEAIAEIGVLYERGEYDKINKEAQEFFERNYLR